jgi:hypothetical protein
MKKILMLGLMSACCMGFAQDAAPADAPPAGRRGGPRGIAPAFIERLQSTAKELLALYDKNGDGKLDEAEKAVMDKELADAEAKARLARFYQQIKAIDSDGDMVISAEESAEAPAKMQEFQQKRMEEMRRNRRPGAPGEGDRAPRRRQGPPAKADQPPAPPADAAQ